jgi:hypothetical protein
MSQKFSVAVIIMMMMIIIIIIIIIIQWVFIDVQA